MDTPLDLKFSSEKILQDPKFTDFFINKSFDEYEYQEILKKQPSYFLKPLNKKSLKTIFLNYDQSICKTSSSTFNSDKFELIQWNESILDLNKLILNGNNFFNF